MYNDIFEAVDADDIEGIKSFLPEQLENMDSWSWTPLHYACRYGKVEAVRVLLEAGADIEARDRRSMTPLHLAGCEGDTDIIHMLADKGGDVCALDDFSESPLHKACSFNKEKAVACLLELGVDADGRDREGYTPLLRNSKQSANIEIAKTLQQYGADIHAVNKYNLNAIALIGHNCTSDSDNYIAYVKYLVSQGLDINSKDSFGDIQLSKIFGRTNTAAMTRALLELGSDPNIVNKEGRNALHHAAACGSLKAIRKILNIGVDVNVRDKYGCTPLFHMLDTMQIARRQPRGYRQRIAEGAEYLVEHGADPFIANDRGLTAIDRDNIVLANGTPHKQVLLDLWKKYLDKKNTDEMPSIPDREW